MIFFFCHSIESKSYEDCTETSFPNTQRKLCVVLGSTTNDLRAITLNVFHRWLLVGCRGFSRGCLSKRTRSWHVCVAHSQWCHLYFCLCARSPEVARGQIKGSSHAGGASFNMEEFHQGATFVPVSMVTAADTNRLTLFSQAARPPRRVETVAALQVRQTPAAALYQSQRQLLPGAQRRDGLQFSNLIAQDNLKVFPQVGFHLQYVRLWGERATYAGFMNAFKSRWSRIIICF